MVKVLALNSKFLYQLGHSVYKKMTEPHSYGLTNGALDQGYIQYIAYRRMVSTREVLRTRSRVTNSL